jgi:two-component system cell cycle sensor histidine kinase PleC
MSAALATLLLGVGAASLALAWLPAAVIGPWLVLTIACLAASLSLNRRFLRAPMETVQLSEWRRNFTLIHLLIGSTWAIVIALLLMSGLENAKLFAFFIVLIVSAMTAMLSFTVSSAVYATMAPVAVSLIGTVLIRQDIGAWFVVLGGLAGQLYFLLLAHRQARATMTTLEYRAEKDSLIAELEQANAISDEARRRSEEANLAKSRFLATMSHELRTPLNAILGFSEIMKNEILGKLQVPAYREYIADIHSSGQHLLNLINEILDLSRIEAGRYELKEEAVQIGHIVDECRHLMKLRAKAKSLSITLRAEPNLPRLWADERSVRQITLNLLSNAIKFTPQGGEIELRCGWTESGGQYIAVRDNGPGIPEEEMPTVLASFGRGSLAIKTAEQGSGLGLPIVKGLVDLHGGIFRLTSKLRLGTEALVIFPPQRVIDTLAPVRDQRSAA